MKAQVLDVVVGYLLKPSGVDELENRCRNVRVGVHAESKRCQSQLHILWRLHRVLSARPFCLSLGVLFSVRKPVCSEAEGFCDSAELHVTEAAVATLVLGQ